MLTLISPAKKLKVPQWATDRQCTQPALLEQSAKINRILQQYTLDEVKQLMGVSQAIAQLNIKRNQQFHTPFHPGNASPAIFTFNGAVYQGLDVQTLKTHELEFMQRHLRILSGLYGLLRPLDLMQPYRLEMGTRLANEKGANLYDFWGEQITQLLNQELATQANPSVINLASQEYFKVVKKQQLIAPVLTPVFKEYKNGAYRVIGVLAKKARGLMARFISQYQIDQTKAIKDFNLAGYQFTPKLSDDACWVFTRNANDR